MSNNNHQLGITLERIMGLVKGRKFKQQPVRNHVLFQSGLEENVQQQPPVWNHVVSVHGFISGEKVQATTSQESHCILVRVGGRKCPITTTSWESRCISTWVYFRGESSSNNQLGITLYFQFSLKFTGQTHDRLPQ